MPFASHAAASGGGQDRGSAGESACVGNASFGVESSTRKITRAVCIICLARHVIYPRATGIVRTLLRGTLRAPQFVLCCLRERENCNEERVHVADVSGKRNSVGEMSTLLIAFESGEAAENGQAQTILGAGFQGARSQRRRLPEEICRQVSLQTAAAPRRARVARGAAATATVTDTKKQSNTPLEARRLKTRTCRLFM